MHQKKGIGLHVSGQSPFDTLPKIDNARARRCEPRRIDKVRSCGIVASIVVKAGSDNARRFKKQLVVWFVHASGQSQIAANGIKNRSRRLRQTRREMRLQDSLSGRIRGKRPNMKHVSGNGGRKPIRRGKGETALQGKTLLTQCKALIRCNRCARLLSRAGSFMLRNSCRISRLRSGSTRLVWESMRMRSSSMAYS